MLIVTYVANKNDVQMLATVFFALGSDIHFLDFIYDLIYVN